MKRLNFGCGSIQPDGWANLDTEDFGQSLVGTTELLPDDHYDIIVAHCSLQMIEWHKLVAQLIELRRILKPEGTLRISLPDIEAGFRAFQAYHIDWFPNSEEQIDERFSAWLTWYSTSKTLLTKPALFGKLYEAGFGAMANESFGVGHPDAVELDTREGECYFVEAVK